MKNPLWRNCTTLKVKLLGSVAAVGLVCALAIFYGIWGSNEIDDNLSIIGVETYPVLNLSSRLNQLVLQSNHEFLLSLEGDSRFDIDLMRSSLEFREVVEEILKLQREPEIEDILAEYLKYVDTAVAVGRAAITSPTEGQKDIVLLSQLSERITHRIVNYHNNNEKAFAQAIAKIAQTSKSFKHIFTLQSLILLFVFLILIALVMNFLSAIQQLVSTSSEIGKGQLDHQIRIDRKDEIGSLQVAFEKMRCSLREHIEHLDGKVKERTLSLHNTQKELRDIFNTIEEGIFTFNLDGSLNHEYSRQMDVLFADRLQQSKTVMDLFQLEEEQRCQFGRWLTLMSSPLGLSQWDKYAKLSPIANLNVESEDEPVYLKIRYKPIFHQEKLLKVMGLARDITGQIEAEKILNSSRQEQAWEIERILGLVGHGRHEADVFLLRFEQCLDMQRAWRNGSQSLSHLMQQLHTLRGNCGTFGLDHLAELILRGENQLKEIKEHSLAITMDQLEVWVELEKEKLKLFGLRNRIYQGEIGTISIDEGNYSRLLLDLTKGDLNKEVLIKRIKNLDAIKFQVFVRRYDKMLSRLTSTYHKNLQPLGVENGEMLVSRQLCAKLDPLLVHLLRNAIIHGIEDDMERKSKGKGLGKIILRAQQVEHCLVFEVEDDGRGLDLNSIRQKYLELGLVSEAQAKNMTDNDCVEKIFTLGFSLKNEVTPDSGRGLGLSAVREEIEKLGGKLSVIQKYQSGCIFRLEIPV